MSTGEPFGLDPEGAGDDELAAAEATELGLREQLNDLVHARSRAEAEARRLTARAALPDADPSLAEIVRRYEAQSAVLTSEIGILRATLRGAEARLAKLKADADGV
jgi:hypothetical protein